MLRSYKERRFSRGVRALLLPIVVALACTACLPELNPMKYASPAPGEEWKPPPDQVPASLPAEKLPGIPSDLEPFADKLDLSQLLDSALRLSPDTRQAWEQARAAAAAWAEARGSYYPTITGSGSVVESKGGQNEGVNAFRETIGAGSLTLNFLLLDFGGRSATVEAARQALFNANWNHNQVIQDILRNVAEGYYTLLGNKAQVRADEENLKDAQTSLQAADLRLKTGTGTIVDVLQAQSNVAQVQLDLVSDRNSVEVSRGLLATAIGWPANTAFDVVEELGELPRDAISQNVEELIEKARNNRPKLAAARATVLEKEAELYQAESAQWPQLVASGQVQPEVARGEGMNEYSTSYFAGVQLQIPIFQGFALTNAVREARAELEAARSALQVEEKTVIFTVWTAYHNFRTAIQQLEAAEVLLASATKSYDASLARYRSGVGDIVELLDAQSTLAEARAERVQANTKLYTSYAELVYAIGEEVPAVLSGIGSVPTDGGGNIEREKK